jgi:hypothetical protein
VDGVEFVEDGVTDGRGDCGDIGGGVGDGVLPDVVVGDVQRGPGVAARGCGRCPGRRWWISGSGECLVR